VCQTHVTVPQAGKGSATLSMAYAAAAFANSCLRAMGGEDGVVDCAYVESNVVAGLPFFAGRLRLGPHGVAERLPLGPLSELESQGLEVRAKLLTCYESASGAALARVSAPALLSSWWAASRRRLRNVCRVAVRTSRAMYLLHSAWAEWHHELVQEGADNTTAAVAGCQGGAQGQHTEGRRVRDQCRLMVLTSACAESGHDVQEAAGCRLGGRYSRIQGSSGVSSVYRVFRRVVTSTGSLGRWVPASLQLQSDGKPARGGTGAGCCGSIRYL